MKINFKSSSDTIKRWYGWFVYSYEMEYNNVRGSIPKIKDKIEEIKKSSYLTYQWSFLSFITTIILFNFIFTTFKEAFWFSFFISFGIGFYFFYKNQWSINHLKKNLEVAERKLEVAEREFEIQQNKKGLFKFEGKWRTLKQIKNWKEVIYGISNNFMNIKPYQFESYIAKLFRKMGYNTTVTNQAGDYGVDVVAKDKDDVIAIQVKHNKQDNKVSNRSIQQILGAMYSVNANKSMLITTSDFTRQAKLQAMNAPIELWNSNKLKGMVRKYFIDSEENTKQKVSLQERLDRVDFDKEDYDLRDIPTQDKKAIREQMIAEKMERESRFK